MYVISNTKKRIKQLIEYLLYRKNNDISVWWNLRLKCNSGGGFYWINKVKYNKYMDRRNSFIPIKCEFKSCPTFPHGISGIFISSGAKIGRNCTIFHQVTIGSNTLADSRNAGSPTIGNNVYIGCGVKIIGNITVGDNVRIGANCIIAESIPDNCTVVMNKPRIIEKANMNNTFVAYEAFRDEELAN